MDDIYFECRIKEVLLYGNYVMKKIELLNEQQLTPNQVREQLGLNPIGDSYE